MKVTRASAARPGLHARLNGDGLAQSPRLDGRHRAVPQLWPDRASEDSTRECLDGSGCISLRKPSRSDAQSPLLAKLHAVHSAASRRIVARSRAAQQEISEASTFPQDASTSCLTVPVGADIERHRRLTFESGFSLALDRSYCLSRPQHAQESVPLVRAIAAVRNVVSNPVLVLPGDVRSIRKSWSSSRTSLGSAQSVRFPGWVDPADLEALYRASTCSVSRPVMKDLACRFSRRCVTRSQSLAPVPPPCPRLPGDAALYFDPERPDQISAVLSDC